MNDDISKAEIGKDAVEQAVTAAATTVGQVTHIITAAVKDVAVAIGSLATDLFEIQDAARRASADRGSDEPNRDLES